jgi:integrase/recombinase XerD
MDAPTLFEQFVQAGLYLRGWSPKTVVIYRRAFVSFTRSQDNAAGSTELTKVSFELWIVRMRQRGLSPAGCNIYIRAMNAFSSWLQEQNYIAEAVVLRQIRVPQKQLAVFSDAEVAAILAHRPKRFTQIRLWTLINLLIDTGMRIDEALTLRTDRVDFDNLLLVVAGKGGRERKIPFSPELRRILFRFQQAMKARGLPYEWLFSARSGGRLRYRNVYRDIKRFCEHLGVRGAHVRPHCFRHFFAISYIRNGGDLYSLSRILGHSSVKTTEIYLRSLAAEQIATIHRRVSPLARLAMREA